MEYRVSLFTETKCTSGVASREEWANSLKGAAGRGPKPFVTACRTIVRSKTSG